MIDDEIHYILRAPISNIRPATIQEKKRIFQDKKNGSTYVCALASNQTYFCHLDSEGITCRPDKTNNLLPHLKEFTWTNRMGLQTNPNEQIRITLTPGITSEEIESYRDALILHPEEESEFSYPKTYGCSPMLLTLLKIKEALRVKKEAQLRLIKANKELASCYITHKEDAIEYRLFLFSKF